MSSHNNYNPRWGDNGRVGKDDFSIDGKSWEYRNPDNFNDGNDRYSDKPTYNRNAYAMTNPLYDFSYGQVSNAAKLEGITNVNSQKDVDRLMSHLQAPPSASTESEIETVKKDKSEVESTEEPVKPIPPSQEITEAKERIKAFDAEMRGNRFNVYGGTPKESIFSERSKEIYDPDQLSNFGQGSSISAVANEQAQLFAENKLDKLKKDFNFKPILS